MQISLDRPTSTEVFVSIQLEKPDYKDQVAAQVRAYAKKSHLRGFRRGNVPAHIIHSLYGRSILEEEINKLLQKALTEQLSKAEIKPLGSPILFERDQSDPEAPRFTYKVGVAGDFVCHLSKDIEVVKHQVQGVEDAVLQAHIERERRRHGVLKMLDHVTADSVVCGHMVCTSFGTKHLVEIVVAEAGKEAEKKLKNAQQGTQIDWSAQTWYAPGKGPYGIAPKLYEQMQRASAPLSIHITEIYTSTPATLDQPFFDAVLGKGVVSDKAAFYTCVEQRLQTQAQEVAQAHFKSRLKKALTEHIDIALPDAMLQSWLEERLETVSKEDLTKHYQAYAQELRWELILAKTVQDHHIQTTQDEVVEEVYKRLQRASDARDDKLTHEQMHQMAHRFSEDKTRTEYGQLIAELKSQKAVDVIEKNITINVQSVEAGELEIVLAAESPTKKT